MPVIQVIPDRFKKQEQSVLGNIGQGTGTGKNFIRRPVRGLVIKDDTFASLRVVAGSGKPVPIIDAGSRRLDPSTNQVFEVAGKRATDIYSNFLIQSVNEERAEKQQILETFGEPFIFLFGERARLITFTGVLLNTFDFNWEAEWWWNYDNYLRGTRCVENDARVFLNYDETLVTGYIIASAAAKNPQEKNHVNFQFQMFLTSYTNFSRIGNPNALPGIVPDDELLSFSQQNTIGDLSPFRPTLIDTSTQTGGPSPSALDGNSLADTSLVDGLASQISAVSATFSTIQSQAETVIQNLSDLANGVVIRVPIGFAGAMEFDANPTQLVDVTGAGVIKYSTFDQNEDEYVGTSDQYGSSVRQNGVVNIDPDTQVVLTQNQQMVDTATKIWNEAGFAVPPSDTSAVSNLLVNTGFGLQAIGANANWRSQLPSPTQELTSVSPIRGG